MRLDSASLYVVRVEAEQQSNWHVGGIADDERNSARRQCDTDLAVHGDITRVTDYGQNIVERD